MKKTNAIFSSEIKLRQVYPRDISFIRNVFALCRSDLWWIIGINEEVRTELIENQFLCEQDFLKREYPDAELNIILVDGEPGGKLYVHRGSSNIRIIFIGILPEIRNRGIGSKLIKDILIEASENGKQVSLNVMWYNYSACSLYERLGFIVIEDMGVSLEMRWAPPT